MDRETPEDGPEDGKVRMRQPHRFVVSIALLLASAVAVPACGSARAAEDLRTVHITIHHSAFDPDELDVAAGETVRFVVENTDPIDHEFLVGNEQVQAVHELGTEAVHAPKPGEISVPALTTRVTTYTFPTGSGSTIFGCHLPGHYAYGMRGAIRFG
jgi:uncharacterized cupredoxin-like copper-binding protein